MNEINDVGLYPLEQLQKVSLQNVNSESDIGSYIDAHIQDDIHEEQEINLEESDVDGSSHDDSSYDGSTYDGLELYNDVVRGKRDPWTLRRERTNYIRELSNLIKYNECSELESRCNYRKFKEIIESDVTDLSNCKSVTKYEKVYIDNYSFLSKIMTMMFKLYKNKFCAKKTQNKKKTNTKYIITTKMKAIINTIIVDYYDVVGKNKVLVDWLIKCKMWGIIDLINKRTPINSSDFSSAVITTNNGTELNKINIYITSCTKSLFRFNQSEFIIEFIKKNNMFADAMIPLADTNFMSNYNVIKFVCDENKISTTRKSVRYYHENYNFLLLNFLIENKSIKISTADIKRIFKTKVRRIRTAIRRRSRRFRLKGQWNKKILGITKYNNFKNNIDRYIENIYTLGHRIQIKKSTKNMFFSNGMYDTVIYLIKNESKTLEKVFDESERRLLFEYCVIYDNLENMKLLIDKRVLMINELHKKDKYLAQSIAKNAKKITEYMLNELKVKGVNLTARMIWPRYKINQSDVNKIYDNLNLMREIGILSNEFLEYIIYSTKSQNIVDKMINDYGCKITNNNIIALKICKIKNFLKYTKDLNFNKKRFILKLMQQRNSWMSNKNLAFDLFKRLPDKLKLVGKYGLIALKCGNSTFFSKIIKNYGDWIDLETLKKNEIKKFNTFSINGFAFFGGLVEYSKDQKIIDTIKRNFTDDEIEKLFMVADRYGYDVFKKKNRILIEKLGIQLSIRFLRHIIDDMNYYYYKENDGFVFDYIIKANDGHNKNDDQYKKEVFDIIISNPICAATLLKIHDNEHNYFKFMTIQNIYKLIMKYFDSDILVLTFPTLYDILKTSSNIDPNVLTPYIYTVIRYGQASFNRKRLWYRRNRNTYITFLQFYNLLQLQSRITRSDYMKIVDLCKPSDDEIRELTELNIIQIDDYVPKDTELSNDITDFIDIGKNREENPYDLHDPDDEYYDGVYDERSILIQEIDQALIHAANNGNDSDDLNDDIVDDDDDIVDVDNNDDIVDIVDDDDVIDDDDDVIDDEIVDDDDENVDDENDRLNHLVDEIMKDIEKEEICV